MLRYYYYYFFAESLLQRKRFRLLLSIFCSSVRRSSLSVTIAHFVWTVQQIYKPSGTYAGEVQWHTVGLSK